MAEQVTDHVFKAVEAFGSGCTRCPRPRGDHANRPDAFEEAGGPRWTPNGFDPRWVEVINDSLAGRDCEVQIADLTDEMWEKYIGPLLDAIEDGELP